MNSLRSARSSLLWQAKKMAKIDPTLALTRRDILSKRLLKNSRTNRSLVPPVE